MTYSNYENLLEGGSPVELYEFNRGAESWRFTTSAQPITYLTNEYTPSSITRDNIKQTTDTFKDSMKLVFPRSNQFALQYITSAPDAITTVTIYRGHSTDPDGQFIVYWKGRITGVKTSGQQAEIECESVFTSIRRVGLRARFEYNCRHALYMPGCNANKELFRADSSILGIIDQINVTVPAAALKPDGYYNAGIIVFEDGVSRFITKHVGTTITFSRPYSGLIGGQSVVLYPGCNHTKETCNNKFNNLNNFGGFPWIPTTNPYSGSSIT